MNYQTACIRTAVRSPPIHLIYTELRVQSLAKSVRFYRALGLRPKAKGSMDDGTTFVWLWDRRTRQVVELWHFRRTSKLYSPFYPSRGFDHGLVFTTDNADGLIRKLRRLGGHRKRTLSLGDVRLTLFDDPDGHKLEILDRTPDRRGNPQSPPFLRLALERRPL